MRAHVDRFKSQLFNYARWIIAAASLNVLIGCEQQSTLPAVVPASGVLKINGEPAAGILVQYIPAVESGPNSPTSSGITDEDGEFTLVTVDGRDGAIAGHGIVTLIDMNQTRIEAKGQEVRSEDPESPDSPTPPTLPADSKVRIPASYAIANKDSIKAEVKEDGSPIQIEIKSK